jgi:RNA polymerase sigma factor (sigma-70 family)
VPLDENVSLDSPDLDEVLALDTALKRLSEIDPRQAKVVELRYFAGLAIPEIAGVLGVSERTVIREWNMAKAWLYGEMTPQ